MSLAAKFLKWVRKNYEEVDGRSQVVLGKHIGIHQGQVSRRLKKSPQEGWDITLSQLESLAEANDLPAWKLLKEIEQERVQRGSRRVHSIAERGRAEWDDLFHDDRPRGARFLKTLRDLEALGYSDMLLEISRLVIEEGPSGSALAAANLLAAHEERPDSHRTRLRRKLGAEYREME